MQRKGRKYKDKTILSYHTNISNKLHSIPKLKKNVKSNVVYSIPGVCMLALLSGSIITLNPQWFCMGSSSSVYAVEENVSTTADDNLGTTNEASLSLENYKLTANAVQGTQALASTKVNVSVTNAESYSLILSVEDEDLVNGNTIIKAGNAIEENTWGYRWFYADGDVDMPVNLDEITALEGIPIPEYSYSSVSNAGVTLEAPNLNSSGSVSFTRNLTFAAKFSDTATSGTYGTKGTLSLSVTPKKVAQIGEWTLPDGTIKTSGITTMQEMTPEICNQVSTPTAVATPGGTDAPTLTLTDTRDNNTYTIAKLPDGKCWMTSNLKLQGNINLANPSGNALTPNDTNISANWTLPTSLTDANLANDPGDGCLKNFFYGSTSSANDCYYKVQSYINSTSDAGETGYYSYAAATAGWATSSVTSGSTQQSICPKGWKLPSGGQNSTTTDFYSLFNSMNLGFPSISTTGNTPWNSSPNADARLITQSSPYNFAYTGYADNGSFNLGSANGSWWSSTVVSDAYAYRTNVHNSNLYAGTTYGYRYHGFAVRCVAAEEESEPMVQTFTLNYDCNTWSGYSGCTRDKLPASQTCETDSDSCEITISTQKPSVEIQSNGNCTSFWRWQNAPGFASSASSYYAPGDKITLTGNTTLYVGYSQPTAPCAA